MRLPIAVTLALLAGCGGPDLGPDDLHFTITSVAATPERELPDVRLTAAPGTVQVDGHLPIGACGVRVDATGKRGAHELALTITTLARPDADCRANVDYLRYAAVVEDVAPGPFTVRVYWTRQLTERAGPAGAAEVVVA